MDLPLSKYLKPKAAAAYIKWSESRLAKSRIWGDGPVFIKISRSVIYDVENLDEFMAGNRRTSTSAFTATNTDDYGLTAAEKLRRSTSAGVDNRPAADQPTNHPTGTDTAGNDGRLTAEQKLRRARADRDDLPED